MTMRERIANGKLFTDYCEGLPEDRLNCKLRMIAFDQSLPTDVPARMEAMTKLFGRETKAWIEPPFYCSYGTNISIGENCWIGAGSVVVQDIPANMVAVGNPCKVLREINETDKKYYYKDREFSEADLEEERSLR